MRIGVFGAGAAGALLAGFLTRSGEEVALIARGERLRLMREQGIAVESYLAKFTARPAILTSDPAQVGPVDVIIVAVKAWQVLEAAEALRPMVGEDTCILTLQNGVEAPGQVASVAGQQHALVGIGTFVSMMTGLNTVRHIADVHPAFRFGEWGSRPSPRVARLRHALQKAGFSVVTPPEIDVDTELWSKFAGVASNGGLGAVTRVPIGVWRAMPGTREMKLDVVQEILAVAAKRGVKVPAGLDQTLMDAMDGYPPETTVSMQRDIMQGLPSELDNQLGSAVRMAQEAGVSAPVCNFLYASLLPQELKARGKL